MAYNDQERARETELHGGFETIGTFPNLENRKRSMR